MSGRTRTHTVTAPSSAMPARDRSSGTGTRDGSGRTGTRDWARNALPNRRRSLNCARSRSLLAREGRTPCVERTTRTSWRGGVGGAAEGSVVRSSPRALPRHLPPLRLPAAPGWQRPRTERCPHSRICRFLNSPRQGHCAVSLDSRSKAESPFH